MSRITELRRVHRKASSGLPPLVFLGATMALFALPYACITIDTADQVHDLRLLAMRADPPEVIMPDGGIPAFVPFPMAVTALVADPVGAGRRVHYLFRTCAAVDTDAGRCPSDSSDNQVLEEDDFVPDGGTGEVSVTFTPSPGLLLDAVAEDDLHGFGGVTVPVQLELTAGDESAVGYKRLLFSLPFRSPPQQPNTNPQLLGVTLNNQSWDAGTTPVLISGDNAIVPQPDPALVEEYDRPTFDGQLIHFRESWRYSFFATSGKFNNATSGGTNNLTGQTASADNTWKPEHSAHPQDILFWMVVRDGRGGENWVIRRAHLP
jgi:hypothetical protein